MAFRLRRSFEAQFPAAPFKVKPSLVYGSRRPDAATGATTPGPRKTAITHGTNDREPMTAISGRTQIIRVSDRPAFWGFPNVNSSLPG
jgi:hypothetical protein